VHTNNNAHTHARALPIEGGSPAPSAAERRPGLEPLLNRSELAALLGISTRSLDRRRAAGEVLDPLPGPGQPRWRPAEVSAWIEAGRPRAETWRRMHRRRC
jgi:hypothetical protein